MYWSIKRDLHGVVQSLGFALSVCSVTQVLVMTWKATQIPLQNRDKPNDKESSLSLPLVEGQKQGVSVIKFSYICYKTARNLFKSVHIFPIFYAFLLTVCAAG